MDGWTRAATTASIRAASAASRGAATSRRCASTSGATSDAVQIARPARNPGGAALARGGRRVVELVGRDTVGQDHPRAGDRCRDRPAGVHDRRRVGRAMGRHLGLVEVRPPAAELARSGQHGRRVIPRSRGTSAGRRTMPSSTDGRPDARQASRNAVTSRARRTRPRSGCQMTSSFQAAACSTRRASRNTARSSPVVATGAPRELADAVRGDEERRRPGEGSGLDDARQPRLAVQGTAEACGDNALLAWTLNSATSAGPGSPPRASSTSCEGTPRWSSATIAKAPDGRRRASTTGSCDGRRRRFAASPARSGRAERPSSARVDAAAHGVRPGERVLDRPVLQQRCQETAMEGVPGAERRHEPRDRSSGHVDRPDRRRPPPRPRGSHWRRPWPRRAGRRHRAPPATPSRCRQRRSARAAP